MRTITIEVGVSKATVDASGLKELVKEWRDSGKSAILEYHKAEVPEGLEEMVTVKGGDWVFKQALKQHTTDIKNLRRAVYNRPWSKKAQKQVEANAVRDDDTLTDAQKLAKMFELTC